MESAVGIDGDDDIALSGCESGIANAGEVLGVFRDQPTSGSLGDLSGAIRAAVQHDKDFDLAGAVLPGFFDRGQATGKKLFLIVSRNDDRNLDGRNLR